MERVQVEESSDPSYTNLVHKMMNNPVLVKHKSEMLEPGIIDLVRPDWFDTLKKTPIYQNHKAQQVEFSTGGLNQDKPFKAQTIIGNENHLEVLVVGHFRLDIREHYTCLVVVSCKATSVIGEAICPRGFKDNCKFFFSHCNTMCRSCKKRGVSAENDWCVRQTKVFDGEMIHCAQRLYIESVFEGEFVALARLRIQSKVVFGGSSKISGMCKDIVFMKENALLGEDNMGPTLTLDSSTLSNGPSIETFDLNKEDGEDDDNFSFIDSKKTLEVERSKYEPFTKKQRLR